MATNERSFVQIVWDFFCSLKLTMFLLISLALTSIIGTILPQGALPPEYVAKISAMKLQIYGKLGFFDMYHSWWFITLLYVFSLNLISCSIKRLPHVFKFISEPTLVLGESHEELLLPEKEITFSGSAENCKRETRRISRQGIQHTGHHRAQRRLSPVFPEECPGAAWGSMLSTSASW